MRVWRSRHAGGSVLRELVERGWAELEAKYAAEGKPMPVRPPGR
jgi:hypothetical protein